MSRQRAPRHERLLVTGICLYEVAALWTDLPTVTRMVHTKPWLAAPILAALAVHFIPPERRPDVVRWL